MPHRPGHAPGSTGEQSAARQVDELRAAGVTPIRARDFLAGTAIGSMPKILLAAFAGEAVIGALQSGGVWPWVAFGAAAAAWFGIGAVGKRWLRSSAR